MLTSDRDFVPPFCPNPSCIHHREPTGWKWVRDGTHVRKTAPQVIRRFRCRSCGRSFSTQTFDTTYWLKKPQLQSPLFMALVACSGFRQVGRSLGVAATSLQRQAARLGRHCLLFARVHGPPLPPQEPLVLDGLVGFEFSQYWPFETNVLIGAHSSYVYAFTDSELRRSGRMTRAQKAKRARLEQVHGKPDPQATRKAVESLVALVAPEPADLTIRSDEHRAYPRALANLPHRIQHETVSSHRCRSLRNLLFVVDQFDLLTRHSSANHKRETLAFSKRRQAAMERSAVEQVWRNFMKRNSERRLDSLTPAQVLGIAEKRLDVADVLARRLFPSHVSLPEPLHAYYWRRLPTRQIPNGTIHALKYAA